MATSEGFGQGAFGEHPISCSRRPGARVRRDAFMDKRTGLLHGGAARVSELIRRVVEQVLSGE